MALHAFLCSVINLLSIPFGHPLMMDFTVPLAGNSERRMKSFLFIISVLIAVDPRILHAQVRGKALEEIKTCTIVQADWADGDSF